MFLGPADVRSISQKTNSSQLTQATRHVSLENLATPSGIFHAITKASPGALAADRSVRGWSLFLDASGLVPTSEGQQRGRPLR